MQFSVGIKFIVVIPLHLLVTTVHMIIQYLQILMCNHSNMLYNMTIFCYWIFTL